MHALRRHALIWPVLALGLLSACTSESGSGSGEGGGETVQVTSSDDACELSTTEAPAGSLTFEVANDGSEPTEFYLYGEDGETVVSEVENIGPGVSRDLVVDAEAGTYVTACKPGMEGDGIRGDFTVSE